MPLSPCGPAVDPVRCTEKASQLVLCLASFDGLRHSTMLVRESFLARLGRERILGPARRLPRTPAATGVVRQSQVKRRSLAGRPGRPVRCHTDSARRPAAAIAAGRLAFCAARRIRRIIRSRSTRGESYLAVLPSSGCQLLQLHGPARIVSKRPIRVTVDQGATLA